MSAHPKLSPDQWAAVRARWESDSRKGFFWIVDEMSLPVSAPAVRKTSERDGWHKNTAVPDIDRIRNALNQIPADDRETWVRMAMAVKAELGENGFGLWDTWGQQSESHVARNARDVWKSIRANGKVTIGTLFHEAKAHGWRDDGNHHTPTPEELAERQRQADERARREEAEIAREREETARKAAVVFKASSEAAADHPYLVRKQIKSVSTLREIDADKAAEILGYAPKSDGEPLAGRLLVVPVKQGGKLSTLELIDEAGRKTALAGRGSKAGGYWASERLPEGDGVGLHLKIGEGVATVLTAVEATEHIGVAALSSGNLLAVAKEMRSRYPAATLVILGELVKATGEPDPHAIESACAVGGFLAVPVFDGERKPEQSDFNDMCLALGVEAVKQRIAAALEPAKAEASPVTANVREESDDETIIRLARLSVVEYERVRADEAKRLRLRASMLDKIVQQERQGNQAEGIGFDDVTPWPDPVDGAALLSEIAETVSRFIVCKPETTHAAALWVSMTWLMDVVQVAPLAVITAPEKRCGKSQLLTILGKLSFRPMVASNITQAALFSVIDAWQPSLMIDEADAFMRDNEELRGILNSGHTRDSAYVVRAVGDDFTPKQFSTWGPKAVAGIGHLADTLMDRAIILDLRRKMPYEQVDRLRHAEPGLFDNLASRLCRFADDNRDAVRRARPELPQALNDRAQDNWEPLLAIADVAGGVWPEQTRHAAMVISGTDDASTIGSELLEDIREIFASKGIERIGTKELIEALCSDDEKPWATYNRGKWISPRQVAKRLSGYGVTSKTIRIGYDTLKGYELSQFKDTFSRYLSTPVLSVTTSQPSIHAGLSVTDEKSVPSQTPHIRNNVTETGYFPKGVTDVTDNPQRYGYENQSVTLEAVPILGCDVVTDKKGITENYIEVEI